LAPDIIPAIQRVAGMGMYAEATEMKIFHECLGIVAYESGDFVKGGNSVSDRRRVHRRRAPPFG